MAAALKKEVIKGGAFLLQETLPISVLSPEDFTDEQKLIGQTTTEFFNKEVIPNSEKIESKDYEVQRELIKKGADLGLINASIPEEYDGLELDHVSNMLIAENMSGQASFSTGFGATSSIGLLPIVLFGTDAQKKKYLPKIGSGEWIGAYCLSESGSGSDALAARSTARLSEDGQHWILNGEKMWITNGGFADIFIVFAKVDGEQFTAFIVERGFPGVSTGHEEHKMGLHGSSTTPLILQDARVPAANVLGEIGSGHKVAFNVLNYGRLKLAAMSSGGARAIVAEAAAYAVQRKQFGRSIGSFGAIKHKLAEMTIRQFAVESMLYRTAGLIDGAMQEPLNPGANAPHDGAAVLAALEEFAIEASILKVAGSEMLDFVVDENVQIHGGNGFVRDYPAERHYRDARVNRIFEGTNEINRLLIPGMLIRRALKGTLPLIAAARKLQDDILSPSLADPVADTALASERAAVSAMRKVSLMVLGTAMQTYGEKLTDEQEILTLSADIIIDLFAAESVLLRAAAAGARPELYHAAARVFIHDAAERVETAARTALGAMAEGDTLRTLLAALRRLLKVQPVNTVALRRVIADAVIERKAYVF
ncbi:MAG: acyl-CoA dehydrogenase family protein [Acidobacteriota bacterium]|nr:acyl-CoA dehydrogenase family protein [Acidobacteriota bacterium]